jgi:iron complex transport system ATP-binding protein
VLTPELVRTVFDLDAIVLEDPETGRPLVIPRDRRNHRTRPAPGEAHSEKETA